MTARVNQGHKSETCIERRMLDQRVQAYQVVREIGRGGMGLVFLARDIALHRLVAIKVLRHDLASSDEQRERFRREARVTAQLNDEGIVAVHGFGEIEDLVYIVMEYVRGQPLVSRLAALGRLAPSEAREILISLATTLDHAHARGIVHRDLKPENVILERETGRALLTDFGVALSRSLDPLPSEGARAFGTPHFMSPEQAAGETGLDARSDIYALGVLGYLMLTGDVPFSGEHFAAIASKHINEAHVPLRERADGAPADLVTAIERCLRKDPKDRWKTARDVAHALAAGRRQSRTLRWVSRFGRVAALLGVATGLSVAK